MSCPVATDKGDETGECTIIYTCTACKKISSAPEIEQHKGANENVPLSKKSETKNVIIEVSCICPVGVFSLCLQ